VRVLNVSNTAIATAIVFGGYHLLWSILVFIGYAQRVIDFVLWAHFIKPVYTIEPFEISRAAVLLLLTTVVGYVVGGGFAIIWNALHRR